MVLWVPMFEPFLAIATLVLGTISPLKMDNASSGVLPLK